MQKKLTLRLEESLIRKARRVSRESGKSVSRIVADYMALIEEGGKADGSEITPRVRSLFGALAGVKVSEEDYARPLEAKHR